MTLLAASFARASALGRQPAPGGGTNASIFVGGVAVSNWQTTGAVHAAICAAYRGSQVPAGCGPDQHLRVPPRELALLQAGRQEAHGEGGSVVQVQLFCTGSMQVLHDFCGRFILDAFPGVAAVFGSLQHGGQLNFSLVPAGALRQVINSTGSSIPTPVCTGGWAECELHALYHCATLLKPDSGHTTLAGCLYWATAPEGGGRGNFYSDSNIDNAPLDSCMHTYGDVRASQRAARHLGS